ncbi:Lar family restriction alleviation protein [Acinetobacter puyangensis]|uniref:Lar family restriction alleviation protein n=1 Tax=Acinetobacter puyangensis TaxID=1096779 RepID=UPI003A4E14B8
MANWNFSHGVKENTPDIEPLNCPFCGSESICIDSSGYVFDHEKLFDAYAWCHECGARGAMAQSSLDFDSYYKYSIDNASERAMVNYAITVWNRRI